MSQPVMTAIPTRPQFSLRAVFGATTWSASVAGLAASHLAGWTMFAIGFSVACCNCAGWLAPCQKGPPQSRVFRLAWLCLFASLLLPAVQGCGTTVHYGWEAGMVCCEVPLMPFLGEDIVDWFGYALYCLLALANLLLALSPLFLWRLRLGKGHWFGAMFVAAASAMWCLSVSDANNLLVGYYAWCSAGLIVLCAFPMRWAMLPLAAVAPVLVWFAE
jgi:hypothetical protein